MRRFGSFPDQDLETSCHGLFCHFCPIFAIFSNNCVSFWFLSCLASFAILGSFLRFDRKRFSREFVPEMTERAKKANSQPLKAHQSLHSLEPRCILGQIHVCLEHVGERRGSGGPVQLCIHHLDRLISDDVLEGQRRDLPAPEPPVHLHLLDVYVCPGMTLRVGHAAR